jgi:ABC-type dipeptide/oligopeptide/nickel transport system permease subunit
MARMVRGSVLSVKHHDYVVYSRCIGASTVHAMRCHVLPNVVAPIIVYSTLLVARAILTAASLSFLGLGAKPPSPEWGAMLADSQRFLLSGAWWMATFPGIAILVTVLSLNLVGDGLRDILDPTLRNR